MISPQFIIFIMIMTIGTIGKMKCKKNSQHR